MKKLISAVGIAAAAALALSACAPAESDESPGGDGAADLGSITLALTSPAWSAGYAPFAVAEQLGYFDDEGLGVDFVLTEGGSAAATQVAQGGADVGTVSTEPIMVGEATGKGLELVSFYNLYRKSIFSVRAPESSGIASIDDLKGKRVGVPSLAAVGVNILVANLQQEGLTRDDVTLIEIGAGPQAVAAVEAGAVDAVASDDVMFAQLGNAGIDMVDLSAADIASLMSNGLVTSRATLEERGDALAALGRAMAKATLFTVTNPEAAIRLLWESHPETKSADVDDETAMKNALAILNARIERLELEDGGQWGGFPEGAYAASVAFALDTGLITSEIDPESLYTNEFADFYNDFDADAIVAQAAESE
jgi:NitT/TauT family transport system substrate-binding protein